MMDSSADSSGRSSIEHDKPEVAPEAAPEMSQERSASPAFQEFSEKFSSFPTPEEKVAFGLQFMRAAISQEGSPRFREFWEARRLVLPCFKENLNPSIRSRLWGEYVELTAEARRLKDILEEQSSFAMEQIDLAIQSIEKDLASFQALLAGSGEIQIPQGSRTLTERREAYNQIQRELNLLNTLASRLNALRKEVIKTDMRIRFKTKFFKRLSELGDLIFPKRKGLIEEISSAFTNDVDRFIEKHFPGEQAVGAPYYELREEIKSLQGFAKTLTLSSSAFNKTRLRLSECWDKLKVLEKEHKKEVFEKRQASSEQRQAIQTRIDELKAKAEGLSLRDLDQEIDTIVREMRNVQLTRDDVRSLQSELAALRAPHLSAIEAKQREMEEAEREKIRVKKEKMAAIKEEIAQLIREGSQMELETLQSRFDELLKKIEQLEAPKMEKQQIERSLRPLKDLVADKKENSLINLSDDDRKALETYRMILQQRKERRQEVKDQLESYRKALGSSNLDFEKAMHYRELVDQEKERLEKANAAIQEIEQKIEELEG
jgi:hypothetical protein